jgi:hypothetical protein
MALQTRAIGSLDGGKATLTYTYDDATLTLVSATVDNQSSGSVNVQLTRTSDGKVYGPFTIPPSTTITEPLPTSGVNRIGITLDARGRIDGAEVAFWS